jgi:hypothetical protein
VFIKTSSIAARSDTQSINIYQGEYKILEPEVQGLPFGNGLSKKMIGPFFWSFSTYRS